MKKIFLLLVFSILIGCSTPAELPEGYEAEMDIWLGKRLDAIIGSEGWATLIDLHWLEEGETRMGSDSSGAIVLPKDVPAYLGSFFVQGDYISFTAGADSLVWVADTVLNNVVITEEVSPIFTWETYTWFVVWRSGRLGVRIRNTKSPEVVNFKGLNYFPLDPEWIVKARYELHDPPRIRTIETVLDMTVEYPNPATLFFEYRGEEYSLEALDEGGDEYFLIFTDETSARETYGAGRYMYASKTPVDGFIILDFNKCYNPPCAFTPYATCPIPPPENQLNVAIRAGELDYH